MLRSFARYFNESVYRGPDTEGGAGETDDNVFAGDTGGDDGGHEGGDDSGEPSETTKEESLSVRDQIKKAMTESSEAAQPQKKKKEARTGNAPVKTGESAAPAPTASAAAAPESLPKELKTEWDKTPPAIQAAFVKREQDMAQGVQALRQRYELIDQAIAPHNDALRQMNATPGEAVNRMFLWFKALANSPNEAFPALAKSMGRNWDEITGKVATQPGQQQVPAQQGAPEIPEPVKNYVSGLERQIQQLSGFVQQLGGKLAPLEQNINTQNEARTRENLNIWSKDKKFFDEVRQDMARLIETGIVPLKDGQVDLDTAYERAIYFNPEVRAKVLAEQQQANQQVQQANDATATAARQTKVNNARRASVSLPVVGSPGANAGQPTARKKTGPTSVRESLKQAMAELRDQ
jgi:hypothetical protein